MGEINIEIDFPYPDVERVSDLPKRRRAPSLSEYLDERGITEEQMKEARRATRELIERYENGIEEDDEQDRI